MRSGSTTRGRAASASHSSARRHHHQHTAFRGPLSLLWLALSVGTGPAACYVVLPVSTRVAAASPLPKIVLGSRQGACAGVRSRSAGGGSRDQRRLCAFARRFEQERTGGREGEDGADGGAAGPGEKEETPTAAGAGSAPAQNAIATGIRNARAVRAVAALSRGKGFRAAATALRASATGVDVAPTETAATGRPKRILIIMSDTGGGHRASSQALSAALENLYGDQVRSAPLSAASSFAPLGDVCVGFNLCLCGATSEAARGSDDHRAVVLSSRWCRPSCCLLAVVVRCLVVFPENPPQWIDQNMTRSRSLGVSVDTPPPTPEITTLDRDWALQ